MNFHNYFIKIKGKWVRDRFIPQGGIYMTIKHLRVFNEVAESGKMSIAAAKFYLSQPTVSQIIKEID